jgi:lipopolysaccharide export LptBFGC system permease protein LptF
MTTRILLSIVLVLVGTAIAFVLIFYFARGALAGHWLLYASIWWVMYLFGEVGQAIGPDYSWKAALAGVISESIYFPLSAYIVNRAIRT